MGEDGPERPSNGNGGREITFGSGEGIGSGGALEKEESQEDENLGPNAGAMGESVHSKCLKSTEDNEDGSPSVVERERQVDEYFVGHFLRRMVLFDDIIDVCHSGTNA